MPQEAGPWQEGDKAEYWSASKEQWIVAKVMGCNPDGSYKLNCKSHAQAIHMRNHPFVEGNGDKVKPVELVARTNGASHAEEAISKDASPPRRRRPAASRSRDRLPSPAPVRLASPVRRVTLRGGSPEQPARRKSRSPVAKRPLDSRSPPPRKVKSKSPPPRRASSPPRKASSRSPPPRNAGSRSSPPRKVKSRSPPRRRASPPLKRASSRSPPPRNASSRSPPRRRASPPAKRASSMSPPPRRSSPAPNRVSSRSPPPRRAERAPPPRPSSRSPPPPKRASSRSRSQRRVDEHCLPGGPDKPTAAAEAAPKVYQSAAEEMMARCQAFAKAAEAARPPEPPPREKSASPPPPVLPFSAQSPAGVQDSDRRQGSPDEKRKRSNSRARERDTRRKSKSRSRSRRKRSRSKKRDRSRERKRSRSRRDDRRSRGRREPSRRRGGSRDRKRSRSRRPRSGSRRPRRSRSRGGGNRGGGDRGGGDRGGGGRRSPGRRSPGKGGGRRSPAGGKGGGKGDGNYAWAPPVNATPLGGGYGKFPGPPSGDPPAENGGWVDYNKSDYSGGNSGWQDSGWKDSGWQDSGSWQSGGPPPGGPVGDGAEALLQAVSKSGGGPPSSGKGKDDGKGKGKDGKDGKGKDGKGKDKGKGKGKKEDWNCENPKCGELVFGSKSICFKCDTPKGSKEPLSAAEMKGKGKEKGTSYPGVPPAPNRFSEELVEQSRRVTGLRLCGEDALPGLNWKYSVNDDARRSYAAYLQCPFSQEQLSSWFAAAKEGTNWVQPVGPTGNPIPRKTAWMVAPGCTCTYRYGSIEVEPQEFPPFMKELMQVCMPLFGCKEWPNSCNLNTYEDGENSVGWHSDDERIFQGKFQDIRILSLSLGQKRKFQLRPNYPEPGEKSLHTMMLGSGDLCTMEGMCQKHYMHRVPKESGINEPRINLTWRWNVKHTPRCPAGRMRH